MKPASKFEASSPVIQEALGTSWWLTSESPSGPGPELLFLIADCCLDPPPPPSSAKGGTKSGLEDSCPGIQDDEGAELPAPPSNSILATTAGRNFGQ